MSLVTTKDTLCFICGKIDDQQQEVLKGGLSTCPLTAHPSCIDRTPPETLERWISEAQERDRKRNEEYMKAMDAFWSEMEARK